MSFSRPASAARAGNISHLLGWSLQRRAHEGVDHPRYLLRLSELELLDREQRATERRIKATKFPLLKSLENFKFRAMPSLNKSLVLELARSEYLDRRENVLMPLRGPP